MQKQADKNTDGKQPTTRYRERKSFLNNSSNSSVVVVVDNKGEATEVEEVEEDNSEEGLSKVVVVVGEAAVDGADLPSAIQMLQYGAQELSQEVAAAVCGHLRPRIKLFGCILSCISKKNTFCLLVYSCSPRGVAKRMQMHFLMSISAIRLKRV